MAENQMKVVMVEPGKPAYITEIGSDLESMQSAVCGNIEAIYFLNDALIVANEEAKLIGMEGNRRFAEDIIAGPFFICGECVIDGEHDFDSLPDELCDKYVKQFAVPENITQDEVEDSIQAFVFGF
ncbi:MAG: DUF3846 domain-containing protein [Ruminiclostridium sp.]|nr:DUF3846 domain-containing protein [Ruminiclostridium sp.]